MIVFFKNLISAIIIVTSILLAFAHAAPTTFLSVPFQNITQNPNNTIQASYEFSKYPVIFCYENNLQSVGIVTWPYKGKLSSSTLSISLKTSAAYEGQFADSSGTITITNNQSVPLIVSCEFAF